jgi:glutamate 5-kinase
MRIVVKIGSSTLTHAGGRINLRRIEELARTVSDIKNANHQVILVSSGAIAVGVSKLRLSERPRDIAGKQAAAAVGQCELMYIYDKEFDSYNHTVAQILLTAPDLKCEDRHKKFEDTMTKLMELDAIPIINENDTVATEEIEFGDNDTLAAYVAESIKADLLVLLSDIDGLYTADPRKNPDATLISDVYELDEGIMSLGGGAGSDVGTGGMITKLRAAKIVTEAGCDMIITNGDNPKCLYDIVDGKKVGTRFHSK